MCSHFFFYFLLSFLWNFEKITFWIIAYIRCSNNFGRIKNELHIDSDIKTEICYYFKYSWYCSLMCTLFGYPVKRTAFISPQSHNAKLFNVITHIQICLVFIVFHFTHNIQLKWSIQFCTNANRKTKCVYIASTHQSIFIEIFEFSTHIV